MSDTNNTLKSQKNQYHHLTEKDIATIQALIEQKDKNSKKLFNNSYIATYRGVHRSIISRELKIESLIVLSKMDLQVFLFLLFIMLLDIIL